MPTITPEHAARPARCALAHRGDAVVVGVRRADRRVVAAARVQVVVHEVDAGRRGARAPRSSSMRPSDTHSSRSGQLGADAPARRGAKCSTSARARTARAGHHAVAPRAAAAAAARRRDQLRHRLQRGSARCRRWRPPTASSSRSPPGRGRCARCSARRASRGGRSDAPRTANAAHSTAAASSSGAARARASASAAVERPSASARSASGRYAPASASAGGAPSAAQHRSAAP